MPSGWVGLGSGVPSGGVGLGGRVPSGCVGCGIGVRLGSGVHLGGGVPSGGVGQDVCTEAGSDAEAVEAPAKATPTMTTAVNAKPAMSAAN